MIVGGLDYAYDLSIVAANPVQGYNIAYATHPYNDASEKQPAAWDGDWGYLTQTSPVVVTEFGDGTGSCSPAWDQALIAYADSHNASWTAWAWFSPGGTPTQICKFPALLTDWNDDPTNEGATVKAALLGYDDPAAPWPDAGSDASDDGGDAGGDGSAEGDSGAGGGAGGLDAGDAGG